MLAILVHFRTPSHRFYLFAFPLWISLHTPDMITSLVSMRWRKHTHTHEDFLFIFFGWRELFPVLLKKLWKPACICLCAQHKYPLLCKSAYWCDVLAGLTVVGAYVADTAFTECSVKHPQLCVCVCFPETKLMVEGTQPAVRLNTSRSDFLPAQLLLGVFSVLSWQDKLQCSPVILDGGWGSAGVTAYPLFIDLWGFSPLQPNRDRCDDLR